MLHKALFSAAVLGAASFMALPAKAQDASWGCQVLLCAASSNPSWHGVPYCKPPMHKLISAMKKPGFSWPICHEAKAGKPGIERQEDCPEGTTTSYSSDSERRSFFGRERYCTQYVKVDRGYWRSRDDDYNRQYVRRIVDGQFVTYRKVTTKAAYRSDPYYFDIPNDQGVKERFWFNLRK